jgi:hypothetical protein
MTEYRDWDLDKLIHLIRYSDWGVPVRAMEEVLERGPAATEKLREVLRAYPDPDTGEDLRLWPIVLLGELRDPSAVPDLAEVVRGSDSDYIGLLLTAAEALAKIGGPALPALRSLAESPTPHHRLWAYYAIGRIPEDAAFDLLLSALETDAEMVDLVAMALDDQRRSEAIEPLLRTLERAEPWQWPELEDALAGLHGANPKKEAEPEDWRLRYRWQPGVGFFPLNWATIAAIVRDKQQDMRDRATPLRRSLEEILDEAKRAEPARCDCCGVPTWHGTGVTVCPETAASLAFLQAKMLGDLAEEEELDDLFEVLDEIEIRLSDLEESKPDGKAAKQRWDDRKMSLTVLRNACIWLVQQGIETVAAGGEWLHTEAARAAVIHDSPLPLPHTRHTPDTRPAVRVGRNERCPCGSGHKFKKCCGSAAG